MRLAAYFRSLAARFLRRPETEQEMEEELRVHIEHRADDLERSGIPRGEAERRARIEFGGRERFREEALESMGGNFIEGLIQDARFAARSLRRTPGLTAFVMITLALGIGLSAGTFSMVDSLIFRPYPVPHPRNVVTLVSTTRDSSYDEFSYREYLDIRDKTKSYDGVVASADMQAVGFTADPNVAPRVRGGMLVSGNYFRVLGIEPTLGRSFRDDEDQAPGRNAVIVLGPDFYRHEFSSDPSVLGRAVRLNGKEFTVIGVAPETFPGMLIFGHPDFYMPLAMAGTFSTDPQKNFFEDRDDRELIVRARLKPGVTLEQAQNELAVLAKDFEREYPKVNLNRGAAVHTQFQMRTREDDINWKFSVIFVGLGVAVLLVACTNVAGILLSRARTRTREIAIRLAMGAGRMRLVRLLLMESLILASLGELGGVIVGNLVTAWFRSHQNIVFMTDLPYAIPFRMDTRALVASLIFSAVSAVLCGLAPAVQCTRTDLVKGLQSSDVEMPGRKHLWGRSVLVVAQVAMSLMLLAASFLMMRGFHHNLNEGTDFKKDHLLIVGFDPRLMQYNAEQTKQFYKLLAERVRSAPDVESVGLTQNVPIGGDFGGDFDQMAFVPEGFQMPKDRQSFNSLTDTVDEGYLQTMGIAILRGRGILASDTADTPRVAIVNEHFARHYWPDADALGKHFRLDSATGTPVEIVGIAKTIRIVDGFQKPSDFVYLPLAQHPIARMLLMVHSSGDPVQLVPAVKEIVRSLDPNLPMLHTMSYADLYENQTVRGPGIATRLLAAMGVLGLVMTVAGLYGLVAYNVSRRTREIAIRIAIGAAQSDVLRLVMGKGLVLVGMGTAIGLALGFGIEHVMNSMLFNAGGVDVLAYVVVVPSLLAVTMLAAYVPARKATRIAPTQALRYE